MQSRLQLPQVTLIAIAGNKQGETIAALHRSMRLVDFAEVKLITNVDVKIEGITCINVGGLDSWASYNYFVIKELHKHFNTTHCLIQQHDSWVLDASCWTDEYLEYDLIGARGLSDGRPNFNGGFSIRSHRLQKAIAEDEFISITAPEDEILCRLYRSYIEKKYNFKYCTDEIADKFAYEMHEPLAPTFGFHNFHWPHYRETIVVSRSGAMGDVIMAEPVLHHFHKQGYQVAIDTQPQFLGVYSQHYFPVVPKQHLNPKLPYREVNLDCAYEIKPKQSVLKSYYEMAGIEDGEMRNSRLSLRSGNGQKLFRQKYALIHIDSTGMPYRDAYGVRWSEVVNFLEQEGFLVFQIGNRVENPICTFLNTMSLEFMMFLVNGADLFIGLDSGCAQVAVGLDVPSVIMFGSVNSEYRYQNFDKIRVVQSECPSAEKKYCYHEEAGRFVGSDCAFNKLLPSCTQYTAQQVIEKINELI